MVAFDRYAFDMSKFSNRGHDVIYGIRERYLWELIAPDQKDALVQQMSGQFRAELHDRFTAPIYPFAFAALTFAFLGTPRTTRQSRNFSMGAAIAAVFGLRMAGFALSVMTVKSPMAALLQYLLLFGAIGICLRVIVAGIVLEPSAALTEAINRSNERLLRLLGKRPALA
jgi:lipopolysaccharide export system permease protein